MHLIYLIIFEASSGRIFVNFSILPGILDKESTIFSGNVYIIHSPIPLNIDVKSSLTKLNLKRIPITGNISTNCYKWHCDFIKES